jgi:hypothetical protein
MKKQLFFYAGGLLALAVAGCGGNKKAPEVVVQTDTVVKTEVVEVAAPVDTAAITANYEAQKAKTKVVYKAKPKKQGNKEVLIQPHPAIQTYEPAPAQPAQPAAPAAEKVKVVRDIMFVYYTPSEKATFPGGTKAYNDFLSKNLQYPEKAMEFHVETTVYATVFLDEEGNVTKVVCETKDPGYGFRTEVTRVLMMSPRWMPAREGGERVKSAFTLPITFSLND